ncbi:MAG TPA: TetR/AcrR family transcriptional regulator C-terminal domain-containing protein [Gordonia sp. (in: high G+C Gram-positive bacteria)]|uniref:TetR/AcrR family transcriptional regulator C-terminal domain-containing protein n=1 Tax=unclassified Gordonia (in: high G+C Gram-positive bacteria) TaxID=2657482 RepID=UPI000FB59F30|nr:MULTISPECIES: TetR/AcrR family transcriptional regulator C-terminal domain-containing protein [unclassified Gordonia (in: high G+C Gram-positive bacteria)]RUP38600.1 MAG: TetR/AcrR family transcriptional regulator [Gordonia sp. (in: high G+C Gram-positive bacteria)]HNP56204.1 TetR/AcrR family transcriptional regulator C-terminal domain-containing protein [Gordonia sp. (in: high G+C Gram-positive bacteria)]HRC50345.1 TetR/AcrR family transcriptional regulator C-terminal domain-containing prote
MDTIDLLWRNEVPSKQRGRPPKFSTEQVVEAAIAVADAKGSAFSLRDVATQIGTPVMSLYSYVDSREQLLELMADDARATMAHDRLTGDWRAQLTTLADDNLRLFAEHPWLTDVESERATLGPGTLAKYEHELGVVEPLGLTDIEMDGILTLIHDFARANARSMAHAATERAEEDPQVWWEREGAKLAVLGLDVRFPLASRVGAASGEAQGAARDAETAYRFGLQVILDGVAARLLAVPSPATDD